MDLFITIHDRKEDRDIELDMTTVETYKEATITDIDKSSHICIIYIIENGIRIEEEFDTVQERQERIDELNLYLA